MNAAKALWGFFREIGCSFCILLMLLLSLLKNNMTIILKKGVSVDDINEKIKQTKPRRKKHEFEKYVGILVITEDPLQAQNRLRNEWE